MNPMNEKILRRVGSALMLTLFAWATLTGCDQAPPAEETHKASTATSAAHQHDPTGETCFICDPSKRDAGRLWCKEHGRYEDRCWLCHPELEEKGRLYCKEHFLYEDECFLCHPQLKTGAAAPAHEPASNADHEHAGRLFCHEHGVAEIDCGICQPQRAASLEPGQSMKIRFPSITSAQKVGIQTKPPQVVSAAPGLQAFCEVQYNLNTMARVTPLAGGVIRRVGHDVGQHVAAGEVLVELHSAAAAAAKSDWLSAQVQREIRRQTFERERRLKEQNIAAEKDVLEAKVALRAAEVAVNNLRQNLVNLGFDDKQMAQIEREQDVSARLEVRAPFDGTLVERMAVVGEAAAVGDALFTIADLSSRWLVLSVPTSHLARLRVDQAVEARFDELPGLTIHGRITWIDTSIDPRSRMVRARALVTDGAEQIKTGLFGQARILTGKERPATLIPQGAVQRHEGNSFVFVQHEPDLFALRRVALGASVGERVEVLDGLEPVDPVVTEGSFIVMSEFLKSRLGAGCADH